MDLRILNPSNWLRPEDEEQPLAVRQNFSNPRLSLHSEVDRLFNNFFDSILVGMPATTQGPGRTFEPSLDISSTEKEYLLTLELPGVDEKDVNIEVAADKLIISGEKKFQSEEQDSKSGMHRMERRYGSFRRMLSLPEDADVESITAEFDKGVLSIAIPKAEPKTSKKIPINARSA